MDYRIAERVAASTPSAVNQILAKARHAEARGRDLVYLLRGEPDFATPSHISLAVVQALEAGETHYPPLQGRADLRQAIADRMSRDFALSIDPNEEVLITTGATMGLYAAIFSVVGPGDEVILFDPIYDPYATVVTLAGGTPRRAHAVETGGHFAVPREALEEAISPRTRAILVNNPWNPTGTAMTREELAALVTLAEAHDLVIIADEIYEKIVFDGRQHTCLAALSPEARRRTIVVNSFSKSYAMTGWRLGYNIAPPALTRAMWRTAEQFSRSATTFVQYAGVAALTGPQEPTAAMVAHYAARRQIVTDALAGLLGRRPNPPEATFFYFLDIRPFGKDSQSLADYLLEHGVVTIPGSIYGPAGEGFLRLSFSYNDEALRRGLERMVQVLSAL
ncbi:MAG: pyridoxal phosphate-dependent aminotransferase [Ardenticatenaceae bacterium]|nr:pyridoxal phosphate-dependent aminotransferase [Ardenticatenaceae bacterium]HBY94289.1 aspartate aminotransferase [Chloroflexota bacterium]